jgi:hypothetical protein
MAADDTSPIRTLQETMVDRCTSSTLIAVST